MSKNSKYLERLKRQQEIIKARIVNVENREKTAERKRETRRKILVGSYYLEYARENDQMADIQKVMDGFLQRNSDRVLFELELLPQDLDPSTKKEELNVKEEDLQTI